MRQENATRRQHSVDKSKRLQKRKRCRLTWKMPLQTAKEELQRLEDEQRRRSTSVQFWERRITDVSIWRKKGAGREVMSIMFCWCTYSRSHHMRSRCSRWTQSAEDNVSKVKWSTLNVNLWFFFLIIITNQFCLCLSYVVIW